MRNWGGGKPVRLLRRHEGRRVPHPERGEQRPLEVLAGAGAADARQQHPEHLGQGVGGPLSCHVPLGQPQPAAIHDPVQDLSVLHHEARCGPRGQGHPVVQGQFLKSFLQVGGAATEEGRIGRAADPRPPLGVHVTVC